MSRAYPSMPVVGAGAIVIDRGRVLLVRRSHAPLRAQWSVPGGAVELGETLAEAVVREVEEETGVRIVPVSVLKPVDRIDYDSAGRVHFHYVLIDFLCRVDTEPGRGMSPLAASDASAAEWVPLTGLRESKQFILPDWSLDVVDEAWRQARLLPEIFGTDARDFPE